MQICFKMRNSNFVQQELNDQWINNQHCRFKNEKFQLFLEKQILFGCHMFYPEHQQMDVFLSFFSSDQKLCGLWYENKVAACQNIITHLPVSHPLSSPLQRFPPDTCWWWERHSSPCPKTGSSPRPAAGSSARPGPAVSARHKRPAALFSFQFKDDHCNLTVSLWLNSSHIIDQWDFYIVEAVLILVVFL